MKCPNCETRELVVIGMVMSGTEVALNSCSSCDLRWWETREGNLSLAGVLDLATVGN
jgi:transcription elongation factor Elf1